MAKYAVTFRQVKKLCRPDYGECEIYESKRYGEALKCSEKTCPFLKGKLIKPIPVFTLAMPPQITRLG